MEKTQCYLGAPNAVLLCIDRASGGQLAGRLYHSYSARAEAFGGIEQMTHRMELLYDRLQFPYPGTNQRRFAPPKKEIPRLEDKNKVMSDEEILSKHGDIGTFIVRVQHRQNSSWQGRLTWMEQDKTLSFRSVWEMIKLIESAVDTVSEQEDDDDEDTSWS